MKKDFYRGCFLLVLLMVGLGVLMARTPSNTIPEIENIKKLKTVAEQGLELKKLLERVGPIETQEQMFRSGLPFTGQTHLLIHVIGDYIYRVYGSLGLPLCRDYFLSACYHGFIINTLDDSGIEGIVEAIDKCKTAGPGVSAQCAHAAGHSFVAWHDYNLIKGLEMCDQLGAQVKNFAYFNCYSGAFMENVWGVHNGAPSEKRWVKEDDINYPCDDPRIPEKYLNGCWSTQATLIYQHYNGNLKKTAEACDMVKNSTYQTTCYDNFARQIHPLTNNSVDKVFSLCAYATGQHWQDECILTNVISYWSVGDRQDRKSVV